MKVKKLYSLCGNLHMSTCLSILEEGHEPFTCRMMDVYYDIGDRKIRWFSFESGVFVIKLEKEKNK